MEYFVVPAQKVPPLQHFRKTEKEVIGGLCSLANIPLTPETQRDQERRIRREIANSNERRRMQSINAGFQSLKTLIPHTDGEKLSKAAILQQTAEYIFSLEQEKTRLLQQNAQLKRFIQEFSGSSPKRRRAEDKDEGIGSPDIWEDEKAEDLRREMIELRQQLDKERSVRMMLEEQVRSLEAHLYPEKLKVIAQQVQLQQQEQVRPQHPEAPEQQSFVRVSVQPQVSLPPGPLQTGLRRFQAVGNRKPQHCPTCPWQMHRGGWHIFVRKTKSGYPAKMAVPKSRSHQRAEGGYSTHLVGSEAFTETSAPSLPALALERGGGLHRWRSRCGSGLLGSGRVLGCTGARQGPSCPRDFPRFWLRPRMCARCLSPHQLLPAHGPPAPTQHPTVIVPAPPLPSHHVTVVTMGPSSVINTISTSRQNLDTIVQAIQHIEGTQEKQLLEEEEQRRGAVIVTPARTSLDPSNSDTASDLEAEDDDSMEHSKAGMP